MMKLRKSSHVLFFFILMPVLGIGLFSGPPPRAAALRIGINSFPASLNPVYATTETSQAIINKVFKGLFYFDWKGRIREELVEKVLLSDTKNHLEIIIELKKNIFFPGGKELDAEDVVQTVKLLQNKNFKYPYISNLQFIRTIEKIDPYRFKITLAYQMASWKNYLTFKILNAREIKKVSPETFRDMKLSGTGPYKIKTIKKPAKIVLELNDSPTVSRSISTSGPGKMSRFIEYIVISHTHLAPLKLITNEIDICELQPENVEAYKHTNTKAWHKKFSILKYKKFGYTYLVFNLRNSLITKNLRHFFYNFLVNGDFMARFLKDRGEPVISPFLLLNSKVKPMRLKTTPMETPVHLKILTNSESKLRKELVLFLREELKPSGIVLQPVFLEYHSFLEYLKTGRYHIAVSGFILDMDYDMTDIFSSGSYFNYAHFESPKMDALLERGLRELNPRKREEIYLEGHRLWLEHLPLIPLFNLYYYVGVSRDIEIPGQTYEVVGSMGDFLFNIRQWTRK
ncbi:MAG: ABC transporter substrate-binding protein [Candidatus Aminicenantes bacterium]|nr:MAG: ABC transporter substrate-binding protein [Candidatus Aminicenantes bacterium]